MKLRIVATSALLMLAGCGLGTDPDGMLAVRTDGSTFVRDPASGVVTVSFTVENTGASSVELEHCGERMLVAIERHDGGRWTSYSNDACLGIYEMGGRPLAPGDVITSARSFSEPGTYRGRPLLSVSGEGARIADAVSNAFVVQ